MATEFPPPGEPQTFVELLASTRGRGPDRTAYRQKTRAGWAEVTFGELESQASGIAAGLRALGVLPGERLAIVMPNSIAWPLVFYGATMAGAVTVPVYYGLKPDEIRTMLDHAEPTVVAVTAESFEKIACYTGALKAVIVAGDQDDVVAVRSRVGSGLPVIAVGELAGRATADARTAIRRHTVRPEDLAAIIFTSGTSGGQKGVMLTHRNLLANVAQTRRVIPFGPGDRLLLVLPLHHAFPFMIGLGLVPAIGAELTFENDLRRIRDRMQEVQPTIFLGVPALFDMMYRNVVQNIESEGRVASFRRAQRLTRIVKQLTGLNIGGLLFRELHRRLGGKLKLMVSGGAALHPETQRQFLVLGLPLIQGWGLSEAGPALAVQKYSPWRFRFTRYYERRLGSIGRPLPGVEIRLRDVPEKDLYVNVHNEGELIARGANITPGYWRAPELTADLKTGEWLKTGDLGTIDREGNIRITGRSKFIIVLDSGEKIYPEEVEEKLSRSPIVADIAVRSREHRGKQQVCAVIYPDRDETLRVLGSRLPTPEHVREVVEAAVREAEKGVADFKRVAHIELTDEPLPRTPLRKVMRGQLREAYSFDPSRWEITWSQRAAEESN